MTTFDFERYLNVRSAYGPSFSHDGERLSFLMNTTGVGQVWTLDEPQAWPAQRTFEEDRVTFASWSPERDELLFGMDEGGNERVQFFLLSGDGSAIIPLTDTPEAKHLWGGWSHDGNRFAFASNRREESAFDVYVQNRDAAGDEAELVFEGDGGYLYVGGWDPDDERLILMQSHSSYDQDLYVLDIESGEARHVTPHDENARYEYVNWGPEGDALYLATDRDADTRSLARLDLDTLDLELVVEGGDWNIEALSLDEEASRIAYARNVDGYSELTVGELTGPTTIREFPTPNLPHGMYGGANFDHDADRFAVTVNGPTINPNVYVVETETGAAERWTAADTAGIPRETFVDPKLIHFESFDGLEIPAFFSLPADAEPGNTPVIVDIHGGPEAQRRPMFYSIKQYFCNRGYAYFEPNVRGSSGYGDAYTLLDNVEKRMDSVKDVKAGVEWLTDQRAVDSDRIAVMGGSYGGFMTLASVTEYPDLWAAGIDIVGIANFVTFLENTGEWRRSHREAEYGSLENDRELLEEISPIHKVDRVQAPLFVLHGANDPRVPLSEADQIVEEVRAHDVPVKELVFDDEGHGFAKLENRIEAYTKIADFLDEHV